MQALSTQKVTSVRHFSKEEDVPDEVDGEERVNANLKTPHHCTKLNNCDFAVNWTGIEVINFTLTARTKHPPPLWIAIGFSDDKNMVCVSSVAQTNSHLFLAPLDQGHCVCM